MKKIMFVLIVFSFLNCFAQDALPFKSIKSYQRNNVKTTEYGGIVFKIKKDNFFRFRLYKKEYMQITIIRKVNKVDLRAYLYVSLLERDITPALSIRYNF